MENNRANPNNQPKAEKYHDKINVWIVAFESTLKQEHPQLIKIFILKKQARLGIQHLSYVNFRTEFSHTGNPSDPPKNENSISYGYEECGRRVRKNFCLEDTIIECLALVTLFKVTRESLDAVATRVDCLPNVEMRLKYVDPLLIMDFLGMLFCIASSP